MSEEPTDDDAIVTSVQQHGWHAIAVAESEHSPEFSYSIGLCHTLQHPDVIVFGLENRVAYGVLAAVVEDVRGGKSYAMPGVYEGVLRERAIAVRAVHASQHESYLGYAMGFYREIGDPDMLRAIQLFWSDRNGLFPFELAFDPMFASLQPRLELPHVGKRRRSW